MTAIPANNSIEVNKTFSEACFLSMILLWLAAIMDLFFEIGLDFGKLPIQWQILTAFAVGLFPIKSWIQSNHTSPTSKISRKSFRLVLYSLHFSQVIIPSIILYISGLSGFAHASISNDKSKIETIANRIKDSTEAFKGQFADNPKITDCRLIDSKIVQYQQELMKRMFDEKAIPEKSRIAYKLKIDSLTAESVDACKQTAQFMKLKDEINRIVMSKNITGVYDLFASFNISASAKAIEEDDENLKIYRGLLKNYLIDVIQGLQPMYKSIKSPGYLKKGVYLQEIIFVNT
jgi:hypothetical protein